MSDPSEARIAASVHILSVSFTLAIFGFGLAATFLTRRAETLVPIPLAMLAVLFTAFVLVHLRRPRLAAAVLVGGIWLGTTATVAIAGSVNNPALGAFLIVILAAGFLIDHRAAIWAAAASALSVLVLAYLELHGRLPHPIEQTPGSTAATELTLFAAAAALLADALGRLRSAVSRAERSETRVRNLIDQASDAIVVADADGHVLEASARATEMSGYGRDELTRMRVGGLLAGEQPEDLEVLAREIAPGAVVVREGRLRRKDGSWLPVESSLARLSDGRVQCIVRDVSERKRAEAMQDRLRLALDEAGEGITLFDGSQRLLYANRAFRRLYGSDDAVRPGMHIDEINLLPDLRALWEEARAELAQGRSYSGRLELRPARAERHVYYIGVAPVHERADAPAGFVGIVRDITREAELEESVQLTRQREAVGQLASGLAHDFNNLLTVILGSAEAIRARKRSEDIDQIIEAGQRATALTTRLVSFSRTRAVRIAYVDVNRVVRDASSMLRRLVRESVHVELSLAPQPLWVMADSNQLYQVLVNLATNARDAMPEGGTLELTTALLELSRATRPARVRLPDGPYVVLSVSDTGVGMSEDVIEHVFEPFFTTKQPGSGIGLGLASVHEIVKQSQGAIEVRSEPGKGTRMRIFLPRARAPEARLERAGDAAEPPRRSARILLVEDEALLRGLVARSLEARGHQVVCARNGGEALELGLSEPPDLLVTDVILPGLDGGRLTAQLRERHPELRVLLMSGYEPEALRGTEEDGRTLFLPKPFSISRLVADVDRLLGGS